LDEGKWDWQYRRKPFLRNEELCENCYAILCKHLLFLFLYIGIWYIKLKFEPQNFFKFSRITRILEKISFELLHRASNLGIKEILKKIIGKTKIEIKFIKQCKLKQQYNKALEKMINKILKLLEMHNITI